MYLKNLIMLGFKSFADKTALNFQPGITAIVGPNGCGKSNVADAIRWVLGEQSAKALRGGEMADVIFTGTDRRKSMGMAEVSLSIGEVDSEHLKAAGVEIDFNEVTVTRRVFRDGGSEYFINKTPCRLKDIQQLFMGTGVGRTSYSIMAQGNITQILSSKPEDRRLVFEEAAGITKFKTQKKEALRKLEQTEQNLLRVTDLIREVKRQIGSLQRQAGKARRYKQLQSDLQHLETQLARHQYDVLQAEIQEQQAAVAQCRAEIESAAEAISQKENEISQLRSLLSEQEEQIRGTQQRGHEVRNQIERHEGRVQFNRERLAELASQNEQAWREIESGRERQQTAGTELAILQEKLGASTHQLELHQQALQARREAVNQLEKELGLSQQRLRDFQGESFASAQQLSRARNQINALQLQQQGDTVRLEKLAAEKVQLEEEQLRLEERLREFTAHAEEAQADMQSRRGTVEERQERLRQMQQELAQAGQEVDELLRQQAENRSRLNILEQLEAEHEGFSAGALAALKASQQVIGSLADKIRVADPYVLAVETALGHHLQVVLTEQPESARQILEDLQAQKKGRASVASLALTSELEQRDAVAPESLAIPALANGTQNSAATDGVAALAIVQADPAIQPLIKRLLGKTWIVPDLTAATAIWKKRNGTADFVTLAGELLSRDGIFTGGYANGSGKTPVSVLGRKNQIAELRRRLAQIQEQVSETSRKKGALQSELTALQAGLQAAQTELRSQEVAIATRQGEFNALQNSQQLLRQKVETVAFEIESLAGQEEEGKQKRAACLDQIAQFENCERQLNDQMAAAAAQVEESRRQRELANTRLTETKVSLAGEEQLHASLRQQIQALERRLEELAQMLSRKTEDTAGFLARRNQSEHEIEESQQRIQSLQHDRDQINQQLSEELRQKEAHERDLSERDNQLREQRRILAGVQEQRSGLELETAQKEMAAQNIVQRILEKYQLALQDIRSECITITIVSEGPPKIHMLTPEEMAAHGASTDWTAVGEQVLALQKRLEELGPVNLVAIEEYEETEQRYQFLTTQNDDLLKAKEQLLDVINRINSQTKEMFSATFAQIRENFRSMFAEVFGGGKADLVLVDEGDVLESGIEIVARPPGKQLQSISLLSGGEQTMTAVALLFSIYQVKPSPFCVLDELDAPLDESNINRFIRVLQRFLAHSQFVIITHNKRTIGMANVLYGVTMEEHGVSKIVSVKLHKADDAVPDAEVAPLVPPAQGPVVETEEDKPQKRNEALEVALAG